MTPILIVSLVFLAATGAVAGTALLVRDLRRRDDDRVNRRMEAHPSAAPWTIGVGNQERTGASRLDRAFYNLVEASGTHLDVQTVLSLMIGLAVVGFAMPFFFFENLLCGVGGGVAAILLPLLYLTVKSEFRRRAFQRGLPETLDLLADAVRGGKSLEGAAEMLSTTAPQPLASEFGYCRSQLDLGHSPVSVMERMARRVPLPEFKVFATAVLVHRQTGGNLALLAQRLATSARDRGEFQGHVRAVTAGSRLSVVGLTIGAIVAVFMLLGIEPEYIMRFWNQPSGPSLLGIAAGLQTFGLIWVWRIMRIDY